MQNERERADIWNLQKSSCIAYIAQFLEYDDVDYITFSLFRLHVTDDDERNLSNHNDVS